MRALAPCLSQFWLLLLLLLCVCVSHRIASHRHPVAIASNRTPLAPPPVLLPSPLPPSSSRLPPHRRADRGKGRHSCRQAARQGLAGAEFQIDPKHDLQATEWQKERPSCFNERARLCCVGEVCFGDAEMLLRASFGLGRKSFPPFAVTGNSLSPSPRSLPPQNAY